jgi:hypothetical protein
MDLQIEEADCHMYINKVHKAVQEYQMKAVLVDDCKVL